MYRQNGRLILKKDRLPHGRLRNREKNNSDKGDTKGLREEFRGDLYGQGLLGRAAHLRVESSSQNSLFKKREELRVVGGERPGHSGKKIPEGSYDPILKGQRSLGRSKWKGRALNQEEKIR